MSTMAMIGDDRAGGQAVNTDEHRVLRLERVEHLPDGLAWTCTSP